MYFLGRETPQGGHLEVNAFGGFPQYDSMRLTGGQVLVQV